MNNIKELYNVVKTINQIIKNITPEKKNNKVTMLIIGGGKTKKNNLEYMIQNLIEPTLTLQNLNNRDIECSIMDESDQPDFFNDEYKIFNNKTIKFIYEQKNINFIEDINKLNNNFDLIIIDNSVIKCTEWLKVHIESYRNKLNTNGKFIFYRWENSKTTKIIQSEDDNTLTARYNDLLTKKNWFALQSVLPYKKKGEQHISDPGKTGITYNKILLNFLKQYSFNPEEVEISDKSIIETLTKYFAKESNKYIYIEKKDT